MERCFVIQPFDGGMFDKRFDDVLVPAIDAAGLEPYRVDRDPSVTIPIDEIQSGIQSSRVCLADITRDNPNVWFELGYAIASRRGVVLICASERSARFPFDVQHRSIIRYSTDSPRDFKGLEAQITARLRAIIEKETKLGALARMTAQVTVEGLEQYEIATLVAVAQQLHEPNGGAAYHLIQEDMEKAGFAKIATTLGIRKLLSKGLLESFEETDYNEFTYTVYRVTDDGMTWLFANTDRLCMHAEKRTESDPTAELSLGDVPF